MSQPSKLKNDQALLCLWRKGLPQPITFTVKRDTAEGVMNAWKLGHQTGSATLTFKSYPDGSGAQSETSIKMGELSGVTIEVATIQLTAVLPH